MYATVPLLLFLASYLPAGLSPKPNPPRYEMTTEEVQSYFNMFDKNKDGLLDKSEVRDMMNGHIIKNKDEPKITDEEAAEMITEANGGRDDKMNVQDFQWVLKEAFPKTS